MGSPRNDTPKPGERLAVVNVSRQCNNDCVYCSETQGHDGAVVPLAQVERLLDDLAAGGYSRVNFMGGETTLRKDFLRLLDCARSRGLGVGVATNGVRFASRTFAAEALGRLSFMELSLVSPDREQYRAITRRDNQPRVLRAIRNIIEIRAERGLRCALSINLVVSALNTTAPLAAVELLTGLQPVGHTWLVLIRARGKGRGRERPELILAPVQAADCFAPALALAREHGIHAVFRGVPTCTLIDQVGCNADALEALMQPVTSFMNKRPIEPGIDAEAHCERSLSSRQTLDECQGCSLGPACTGLGDDLEGEKRRIRRPEVLPDLEQVRKDIERGPIGFLLTGERVP